MFKFIFVIITDPLGLPIEWYKEWIILAIIGIIAYVLAYDKVGQLYHEHFISGRMEGSFFHWLIRAFYFVIIWAVTYGAIWLGKFVISHKVEFGIGIAIVVLIVITVKLVAWKKEK